LIERKRERGRERERSKRYIKGEYKQLESKGQREKYSKVRERKIWRDIER
jgi:hypothetical protein